MLKFSKKVPARTKTICFNWCKKDFVKMDQKFRGIRARIGGDPMDSCFWCKHKFINGEMMALAQPEKSTNKALCQGCADELLEGR